MKLYKKDHQTNRKEFQKKLIEKSFSTKKKVIEKKANGGWKTDFDEELSQSYCCSFLCVGYILIICNTGLLFFVIRYTNHEN